MDLSLNEGQQLLKRGVEDFIQREAQRDTIIELRETPLGYSEDHWAQAAEIGWLGAAVPEQHGGTDLDLTDIGVLFEALGYAPLPGPFFSSGVLAPLIIRELGDDAQQAEHLPRIASGEGIYTFALTEPDYGWGPESVQLRPSTNGDGYQLDGGKLFVQDAHVATHVITAVRTGDPGPDGSGGLSLLLIDTSTPGVSARRLDGFLGAEGELRFDSVQLPRSALLGPLDDAWAPLERALLRATPILCAYKVGGSQAVFDMAVEYSRTRHQFGQPIGRFQHVQNHMIQLVNHLDAARWTTYHALWKLDGELHGADVAVHTAKITSSEGYIHATNYSHEVHAGVGVMREYGLTLYTRVSRALYHALGDPQYHRRRLGDLLVDYDPPEADVD